MLRVPELVELSISMNRSSICRVYIITIHHITYTLYTASPHPPYTSLHHTHIPIIHPSLSNPNKQTYTIPRQHAHWVAPEPSTISGGGGEASYPFNRPCNMPAGGEAGSGLVEEELPQVVLRFRSCGEEYLWYICHGQSVIRSSDPIVSDSEGKGWGWRRLCEA